MPEIAVDAIFLSLQPVAFKQKTNLSNLLQSTKPNSLRTKGKENDLNNSANICV